MDIKIEKIKYQVNKVSYYFAMLAIACNITFLFIVLNAVTADFFIGLKILLNIGLMLAIFLGMEKAKTYSKNWSIALIVIGVVVLSRIFIVPLINYLNESIELSKFIQLSVFLLIEGIALIISGIVGYKKSMLLIIHKDEFDKIGRDE